MSSTDQWLCITDYAHTYGVSRPTVYKWMDAGVLVEGVHYYRVESVVRIYNRPPTQHLAAEPALSTGVSPR